MPFVHDLWFETHDWQETVRFWTALGWTVGHDFGTAGSLHPPTPGPYFFVEQVEPGQQLGTGVYLEVPSDFELPAGLTSGWEETGWGSRIARFSDPDGRTFWFQTPGD